MLLRVSHAYNLYFLCSLEYLLIQNWVDCMHFYIISVNVTVIEKPPVT